MGWKAGRSKYVQYEIIIYWSNEDRTFVAEMPELPVAWPMATPMKPPSRAPTRPFSCGSIPPANLEIPFRTKRRAPHAGLRGPGLIHSLPSNPSVHRQLPIVNRKISGLRHGAPNPAKDWTRWQEMGGWRMASIALRLQILAAGAGTFLGSSTDVISSPAALLMFRNAGLRSLCGSLPLRFIPPDRLQVCV